MNFMWLVGIGVYVSLIDVSLEDCRVLADCDGGRAQWQDLVQGPRGRPGKRVRDITSASLATLDR